MPDGTPWAPTCKGRCTSLLRTLPRRCTATGHARSPIELVLVLSERMDPTVSIVRPSHTTASSSARVAGTAMPRPDSPRTAKRARDRRAVVDALDGAEAKQLLGTLLEAYPELLTERRGHDRSQRHRTWHREEICPRMKPAYQPDVVEHDAGAEAHPFAAA